MQALTILNDVSDELKLTLFTQAKAIENFPSDKRSSTLCFIMTKSTKSEIIFLIILITSQIILKLTTPKS